MLITIILKATHEYKLVSLEINKSTTTVKNDQKELVIKLLFHTKIYFKFL